MKPIFFESPDAFRECLENNHEKAAELLVGFYKKASGKPSMTWPESVDQALCFGWIDGLRKRIDDIRYSIRFTPRKPGSIWSAVNIRRATELAKLGLMTPAGLRAFEKRTEDQSRIYSYENAPRTFPPAFEKKFRAVKKAWQYFNGQPPSYRRVAIHWILSAKREETRERRLSILIDDSAKGRRLAEYELKPRKD
ncbi:MAG TPA: YdeI/OmpD-associated family protein [Thermoanaerobaculia bacterium]